jgi:chemotaxis protein CheD
MPTPADIVEIVLQPGEVHFGDRNTRIKTLLGSCVAMTIWHPQRLVGGMCHYMLPSRQERAGKAPDGRYANEALEVLVAEIRKRETRPEEFHAKLFGGGQMFVQRQCDRNGFIDVFKKNIDVGKDLVRQHGFILKAEHLGGEGHRQVIFNVWNGDVWMRHNPPASLNGRALSGTGHYREI